MKRQEEDTSAFRILDKHRSLGVVLIFSLVTVAFIIALVMSLNGHDPLLALP